MNIADRSRIYKKWEIVQAYYEKVYKKRFRKQPSDQVVEDLYQKMNSLNQSIQTHLFSKPGLEKKFYEKSGLAKPPAHPTNLK